MNKLETLEITDDPPLHFFFDALPKSLIEVVDMVSVTKLRMD